MGSALWIGRALLVVRWLEVFSVLVMAVWFVVLVMANN